MGSVQYYHYHWATLHVSRTCDESINRFIYFLFIAPSKKKSAVLEEKMLVRLRKMSVTEATHGDSGEPLGEARLPGT